MTVALNMAVLKTWDSCNAGDQGVEQIQNRAVASVHHLKPETNAPNVRWRGGSSKLRALTPTPTATL